VPEARLDVRPQHRQATHLPATLPVETYDVKIDGDDVLIEVNG